MNSYTPLFSDAAVSLWRLADVDFDQNNEVELHEIVQFEMGLNEPNRSLAFQ